MAFLDGEDIFWLIVLLVVALPLCLTIEKVFNEWWVGPAHGPPPQPGQEDGEDEPQQPAPGQGNNGLDQEEAEDDVQDDNGQDGGANFEAEITDDEDDRFPHNNTPPREKVDAAQPGIEEVEDQNQEGDQPEPPA